MRQRLLFSAVTALAFVGMSGNVLLAGIVYTGQDASDGHHAPQSYVFVENAAKWAGGSADPRIGWVEGFSAQTGTRLAGAGFTQLTQLTSASLASVDLSAFDLLYIGPNANTSDQANFLAASTQIQDFVDAGGGLVVEMQVWSSDSWAFVPDAAAIGHSGSANIQHENVVVTNSAHPVMSGLTSAGLSNWGQSIHSDFSIAGATGAGYEVLATDGAGRAVIIAKSSVPAVPEPTTLAIWSALGGLGMMVAARRRRRTG